MATDAATAREMVDEPEPDAMEVGLKLTVTPLGCPEAVSATAELNPCRALEVMVELPLLPCTTLTVVGEAERLNVGTFAEATSALIRPVPFGLPHPVTRS